MYYVNSMPVKALSLVIGISGGIDSSLQAAIISQYKDPYKLCVVDHGPKDHIMKNIKF